MEYSNINISLISIIPFILMLGAIAVFPIYFHKFWEKNVNKLAIGVILSLPVIYLLITKNLSNVLIHTLLFDYFPFIVLLGSLFIITGGIFIDGDIEATPLTNTIILFIGAVLASFMGTTGASMLLIRPLIKINKERKFKTHSILFFIAIVANCGGLLTPLGDPPLFMMYLRGAPFFWFLHLLPEWLFANLLLLIIYYFVDNYYHKKESQEDLLRDKLNIKAIKIKGKLNFIWLFGVVLSVAFLNEHYIEIIHQNHYFMFIREGVLIALAILSLLFTPKLTREENSFTWGPIQEVAYLFFGIFITMIPCILYLESNAKTLGITQPHQFYFLTGLLSSFLDNTPTAVTFYSLADGLMRSKFSSYIGAVEVAHIPEVLMTAISTAAVLFGSMTYIGNGPNFMVKAIAEESNIKMPDFFSYMYKFSLIILLPIFILINFIFIG